MTIKTRICLLARESSGSTGGPWHTSLAQHRLEFLGSVCMAKVRLTLPQISTALERRRALSSLRDSRLNCAIDAFHATVIATAEDVVANRVTLTVASAGSLGRCMVKASRLIR